MKTDHYLHVSHVYHRDVAQRHKWRRHTVTVNTW